MACGPVLEGHSHWILRLLEEKAHVELHISIGKDAICHALIKRASISQKCLLMFPPKENTEIIACMDGHISFFMKWGLPHKGASSLDQCL